MLMVEFAARLFDEKLQRLPTSIEELVPEFLPAVPLDPFSGNSLIYRQTDSGYDFDLDTLIRPTKSSGVVGFGGMN
ncbi:MAG: hypothetical protein F9B45_08055 [Phycisphaera sp. RhM]|nr:hypothetical protein [Phycisphaera sp. RhM]